MPLRDNAQKTKDKHTKKDQMKFKDISLPRAARNFGTKMHYQHIGVNMVVNSMLSQARAAGATTGKQVKKDSHVSVFSWRHFGRRL